jgi:hypothetical protein
MKTHILLAVFSILVCSCVFSPSKENFIEVNKDVPAPEVTNQVLDLETDSLFVWKYTRFNFNLTAGNVAIHSVFVNFNNTNTRFDSGQGSFEVNPSVVPPGTYTVEIKVYTGSGTGSLADKAGAEGYEFKREWTLVVEKPQVPDIKITPTIENGYLKFSWNKVDKPYFKSYRIVGYDNGVYNTYTREYKNKNITSFVDSTYVGGSITFNLSVNYYDENNNDAWVQGQTTYNFPISVKFRENKDSLRISWNKNPFHCTRSIITNNGANLLEVKSDSTFTVVAPGLGGPVQYDLIFKPVNKSKWSNNEFHNYVLYTLGANDGFKHSNVEYNPTLNSYFFKHEMSVKAVDSRLGLQGSYTYPWDYGDNYTIDFSQDKQNIFTTVSGSILTLNPKMELIKSAKIPVDGGGSLRIRALKSIDDHVFLVASDSYLLLYDTNEDKILAKTPDMWGVLMNYNFSVSVDGKYAAFCNPGLHVYEIRNNRELIVRYEDSENYYGCFFDPKYPEKLVLNCPDDVKIFNCTTAKAERIIDRVYANPVNIDPVTHNMLLVSNSRQKIYVYNFDADKLVMELNHHSLSTDFKLLNNTIFVSSGYHFDLSSYVN